MSNEEGEIPSVVTVLVGLVVVYVSLTPVFGNHILLYGGVFLFLFIIAQIFCPPYLIQQVFVGDKAGGQM